MPFYVEKQVKILGPIFNLVGLPGFPGKMVFVVDPDDAERVFRTGDLGYPKRIEVFKQGKSLIFHSECF